MNNESTDSLQAHLRELQALEDNARQELQEDCEQMQAQQPGLLGKYPSVHLGESSHCVLYSWKQWQAGPVDHTNGPSSISSSLCELGVGAGIWAAFSLSIKMDL